MAPQSTGPLPAGHPRAESAQFSQNSSLGFAVLLMFIGASGFGLMNGLIRLTSDLPLPVVIHFRNSFVILLMLPWALTHLNAWTRPKAPRLHLMRGLIGLGTMFLFFHSMKVLPLADAVTLTFTMPLFVLIGAALILGEVVRIRRWTATFAGFIGAMIIVQPGSNAFDWAYIFPLMAAVGMAAVVLLLRRISFGDGAVASVFIYACVTSVVTLPGAIIYWQTPSLWQWGLLLGMGATGLFAQIAMTRAIGMVETSVIMPFDYLRLPTTAFFGFILFSEVPGLNTWIGAAVIMSATFYIARREAQIARQNRMALYENQAAKA